MTLIRILASRAVAAMRYSSTRRLKLQYQIAYTKKVLDYGFDIYSLTLLVDYFEPYF